MVTIERLIVYWKNTKEMPLLVRALCQGGMFVAPLFLVLVAVPFMDWEVDGQPMSYANVWSSGVGPVVAVSLALVAGGAWGLAARNPRSRWLLVVAPIVPSVGLVAYRLSGAYTAESEVGETLLEGVVASAVIYVCLFHLSWVKVYMKGEDLAR